MKHLLTLSRTVLTKHLYIYLSISLGVASYYDILRIQIRSAESEKATKDVSYRAVSYRGSLCFLGRAPREFAHQVFVTRISTFVKIPSISIHSSSFKKKTERFWLSANTVDTYIITVYWNSKISISYHLYRKGCQSLY